ncbi:unnamed protein product [Dovyalis caffra]|uniref:Serpin domain-containing protein n=1 Tax=Dovyalis caffra TaxID=77055 RepID=A0AAV1SB10_9ROSI|nr:unnamed protein product [Dovyalis caffra]
MDSTTRLVLTNALYFKGAWIENVYIGTPNRYPVDTKQSRVALLLKFIDPVETKQIRVQSQLRLNLTCMATWTKDKVLGGFTKTPQRCKNATNAVSTQKFRSPRQAATLGDGLLKDVVVW